MDRSGRFDFQQQLSGENTLGSNQNQMEGDSNGGSGNNDKQSVSAAMSFGTFLDSLEKNLTYLGVACLQQ